MKNYNHPQIYTHSVPKKIHAFSTFTRIPVIGRVLCLKGAFQNNQDLLVE